MMTNLETYRTRANGLKTELAYSQKQVKQTEAKLEQTQIDKQTIEQARTIAQFVAQSIQQRAHDRIASVVTRCLEAVFDHPYTFQIQFEQKRGRTEALLMLTRDGKIYTDPVNEVGGGVVDIVSLSLRLAVVMLSKPKRRRLLVLDEPFRNVRGRANRKRLRGLLMSLSDEMGFQFILNVDADSYPEFVLGNVVEMS